MFLYAEIAMEKYLKLAMIMESLRPSFDTFLMNEPRHSGCEMISYREEFSGSVEVRQEALSEQVSVFS